MKTRRKRYHNYRDLYTGKPVNGPIKIGHAYKYYVWQTKTDSKVRSHHDERHGKIFAWENPPKGGHPGQDFNCRCKAIQLTPSSLATLLRQARSQSRIRKRANTLENGDPGSEQINRSFLKRKDNQTIKARNEWVRAANQAYDTIKAREEAAYIQEQEDKGLSVPDYLRERSKRATRDNIRLASAKETRDFARKNEKDSLRDDSAGSGDGKFEKELRRLQSDFQKLQGVKQQSGRKLVELAGYASRLLGLPAHSVFSANAKDPDDRLGLVSLKKSYDVLFTNLKKEERAYSEYAKVLRSVIDGKENENFREEGFEKFEQVVAERQKSVDEFNEKMQTVGRNINSAIEKANEERTRKRREKERLGEELRSLESERKSLAGNKKQWQKRLDQISDKAEWKLNLEYIEVFLYKANDSDDESGLIRSKVRFDALNRTGEAEESAYRAYHRELVSMIQAPDKDKTRLNETKEIYLKEKIKRLDEEEKFYDQAEKAWTGIDKLAQKLATKRREKAARARAEKEKRKIQAEKKEQSGNESTKTVTLPVPGDITQKYKKPNPEGLTDKEKEGHKGIDLGGRSHGVKHWTPVVAPEDGKIVALEVYKDKNKSGWLRMKFSDGTQMSFSHIFPAIKKDQKVKEGQVIGFIDDSGKTSGPHLHIVYYPIPNSLSKKSDPEIYFNKESTKPYPWEDIAKDINEPHADDLLYTGDYYKRKRTKKKK